MSAMLPNTSWPKDKVFHVSFSTDLEFCISRRFIQLRDDYKMVKLTARLRSLLPSI